MPTSAVAAVLDNRVELSLTKEQIERGNYTSPIGDGDSDAYPETMSASGTASHGTAHIADRDVSERSEERRTVDEDVDHLGRMRTLGGQATPARTVMDIWVVVAVVIVLATLGMERSRAYRVLPAALNRLRRWRAD